MTNITKLRDLQNKNIVITGASSGIGWQVALKLAAQNANLILIARRKERLLQLQKKCRTISTKAVQIQVLDVSDTEQVQAVVEKMINNFHHLDVLINAAGFGDFTNFMETDYALWNQMFRVNVLGTMLMTRYIAANMMEQELGQIFNIGSMGGKIATPKAAVYSATKAAVIAFSNSLRLELKPFNIQVTTVNPGPVNTDFFKQADHTGRYVQAVDFIMLDPEKLAQKIVANIGHVVREINVPFIMEIEHVFYEIFPRLGDWVTLNIGNKK